MGDADGETEGEADGLDEGLEDGEAEGGALGNCEGNFEGAAVGSTDGIWLGSWEGRFEGVVVGMLQNPFFENDQHDCDKGVWPETACGLPSDFPTCIHVLTNKERREERSIRLCFFGRVEAFAYMRW